MKNPKEKDFYLKNHIFTMNLISLEDQYKRIIERNTSRNFMEKLKKNSKLYRIAYRFLFRKDPYREWSPACSKINEQRDLIENIFKYLKETSQDNGGKFYIVYLPYTRFFIEDLPLCEYEMISSMSKKLDIPFIDMLTVFKKQNNPRDFFSGYMYYSNSKPRLMSQHCNRKGYELIAETIIETLNSQANSQNLIDGKKQEQKPHAKYNP